MYKKIGTYTTRYNTIARKALKFKMPVNSTRICSLRRESYFTESVRMFIFLEKY